MISGYKEHAMMRYTRGAIPALAVVMVALLLSACGGLLGPRDDDTLRDLLNSREKVWQEKGPSAYAMTVLRLVDDGDSALRGVVLHVEAGQIVAGEYDDTGEMLAADVLARHLTVEGMFDLIRDALNRKVAGISVNYDADYGYPREIIIDYTAQRADDDVYIAVSDFSATS
jgi:hypothetical protein